MFLTVHSAVGLTIANYIKNPLLAFFVGFILHYVFDIIPHGDTQIPKKYHNIVYITLAGFLDLAVLTSFLLILMLGQAKFLTWTQIAAISGSVIPDLIQFIYFLHPRQKHLLRIQKVHDFFHGLITNKKNFGLIPGLILQIILFLILQIFIS
ncbi:MAG: hypothetical protein NTX82_02880 [Candidatus Parcubacteria bacterium]|nr:hypothetical protein [Candidatus Parcubacteria bacterium]